MSDLSTCGFKMGPDAPRCGAPAATAVEFVLPKWLDQFTQVAEDQRRGQMGLCPEHEALLTVVDPGGMIFSYAPGTPRGPRPSAFRADLPIPDDHAGHRSHVPGCLGCDLDFGPKV